MLVPFETMTRWLSMHIIFTIFSRISSWQHKLLINPETGIDSAIDELLQITEKSCFVSFSSDDYGLSSVFDDVSFAFSTEDKVVIGFVPSISELKKHHIKLDKFIDNSTEKIIVFPKRKLDRSCLYLGGLRPPAAQGVVYTGPLQVSTIVEFINEKCLSYRQSNGYLTIKGLHRQDILRHIFYVENASNTRMKDFHGYCFKESCQTSGEIHDHSHLYQPESNKQLKSSEISSKTLLHQCEKIEVPSKSNFFHKFLKRSKPVIIKNAINNWPAFAKWSNSYFKMNYGDKKIHIKLTPEGVFEGVDFAFQFENYDTFNIPEEVKKQLLFPDVVVVRPATKNMNFSDFIDLIESVADGSTKGISAYLEYFSLSDIEADLENDVYEMPFIKDSLYLQHRNIWLSDGKTLGKLHFDPFDNFLCQISGKKEVILFSPHNNTQLYEAHIPEAKLEYDNTTKTFKKKKLMDSTSMVMSPVDLDNPNYQRFPKFADAYPMNCTIEEGEVLFMPAFWWHEVKSYPSRTEKRNLAVNFWYEPFLTKEFPCQECKLDVNPNYRHLL